MPKPPIVQSLSALELTFIILILLQVLMWIGVAALSVESFSKDLSALNHTGLFTWMTRAAGSQVWALLWMGGLCVCALILLINAFFCTLFRQLKQGLKQNTPARWLFIVLHMLFILLLAGHGLIMVFSEKQADLHLFENQSLLLADGSSLHIRSISYTAGKDLLTMKRFEKRPVLTRERFDVLSNHVRVSVMKNGRPAADGTIRMLAPLHAGPLRINLIDFTLDKKTGNVGVILTLTRNGWDHFFFCVYVLLIGTLAGFTALTWNRRR